MKTILLPRGLRAGAVLVIAAAGGALSCGSPTAPEVPSATLHVAPIVAPAGSAAPDACAKATARVIHFAESLRRDVSDATPRLVQGEAKTRYLREWPPWCLRALAEKTRAQCGEPESNSAVHLAALLIEAEERRKTARFRMSRDGRWLVEWASVHHVVRIWETPPEGPRLAFLLAPAEDCTPQDGAPDGRIVCHVRFPQQRNGDDRQYLLVLDTRTGTVRRFDDVEGWERSEGRLVLASHRSLRRVDWATLAITADVPWPKADYATPFTPALLASGRSVLLNDTLVSLESGAVLAQGLEQIGYRDAMPVSPDRSRLIPCVGGARVILDTATGATLAISGKHGCDIGLAFTADGGRAVGVDETAGNGFHGDGTTDRVLTPFVVDAPSGASRSFSTAAFRVARRGSFDTVYLPADRPGRACLSYAPDAGKGLLLHGPDKGGDVCPWQLDAAGLVSKKAATVDPLSAAALKLRGVEIARATSPDGARALVVTAEIVRRPNDAPLWDLRVTEVSVAERAVLRAQKRERAALNASDYDPERPFVGGAFPGGVGYFGPDRAVLATSPLEVLDLARGTFDELAGDHLAGRWAVSGENDALIDLATLKKLPLEPDDTAYRGVKTYGSECPERLDDIHE